MFQKGVNYLLWDEHLPTASARVESLRINGYHEEAIRYFKSNLSICLRISTFILFMIASTK